MTSMRPEHDPELCSRLTSLYTFLFNHLVAGSHEKDLSKIDKVIELLEYERQTWTMLIAKVVADRAPGPAAAAAGSAGSIGPSGSVPALSVHG
jgi:flagellin-specific chaperone FliS